jgi:hypothetical protein
MLEDVFAQWRKELKAEGQRELLLDQLHRRFGRELPRWVEGQVEKATTAQLKRWGRRVLKAASLHELFGRPQRAETGRARSRAITDRADA